MIDDGRNPFENMLDIRDESKDYDVAISNDSEINSVVDDFERASKAIKKEDESYLEGFNLIHQKLISTLEKYSVKKMEIKKGDNFDSEYHEAITSTPSEKKYKGKIIDVVENGYHIGDNILRFAKVVTGS